MRCASLRLNSDARRSRQASEGQRLEKSSQDHNISRQSSTIAKWIRRFGRSASRGSGTAASRSGGRHPLPHTGRRCSSSRAARALAWARSPGLNVTCQIHKWLHKKILVDAWNSETKDEPATTLLALPDYLRLPTRLATEQAQRELRHRDVLLIDRVRHHHLARRGDPHRRRILKARAAAVVTVLVPRPAALENLRVTVRRLCCSHNPVPIRTRIFI